MYDLGEEYGSEFWDAAGGDFSGFADLGMSAGATFAINKTFGEGFASGGPQEAVGSQVGQMIGYALAGPLGMIVGGMFGAIGGDMFNSLMGNSDVDYDFKTSQGTEGFEDGKYITTPFGNIGFNASSTRNLSMNKVGNPMLGVYANTVGRVDQILASMLTEDEIGKVRVGLEGNIDNSHKYGPDQSMKMMLRDRMSTIDSTLTAARKKETGWAEILATYNEQYAPVDRSLLALMEGAQAKIDSYDADMSNFLGYRGNERRQAGEAEMKALLDKHPELNQVLDQANDVGNDVNVLGAWKPRGLAGAGKQYYDRIDESNAKLRV